jgi:cell division protein FtsB
MASALRVERQPTGRQPVVRTRVHSDGGAYARPMVRSTVGVSAAARPQLIVVPRRRRTARLVAVGAFFVTSLMLGAAAFQTQLARRQVELDRLDRQMQTARNDFNSLRQQRAELRSPGRLATSAAALGMRPANDTDFVTVSPDVVGAVQQSAGGVLDPEIDVVDPVFDEFKRVKSIAGG